MILKEILSEITSTDKPVVRKLQNGKDQQVLAIGLRKNALLKEHTSAVPATLYVLQGEVIYNTGGEAYNVKKFEEQVIIPGEAHSVTAIENSLFLVIKE